MEIFFSGKENQTQPNSAGSLGEHQKSINTK